MSEWMHQGIKKSMDYVNVLEKEAQSSSVNLALNYHLS